jgi:hypothetical protein
LIKRAHEPSKGRWSIPGGMIEYCPLPVLVLDIRVRSIDEFEKRGAGYKPARFYLYASMVHRQTSTPVPGCNQAAGSASFYEPQWGK